MRYDTKVNFYKSGVKYDPHTHKYSEDSHVGVAIANVTDFGTKKQMEILGELKPGSKVIRLTDKPNFAWDYLKIDDAKYRFVSSLHVLKGYSVVVGQDNG